MTKIIGRMILLFAVVVTLSTSCACTSKGQQRGEEKRIERPVQPQLSLEEAEQLVGTPSGGAEDDCWAEAFASYAENNKLFAEEGAPWNGGKEALNLFVKRFEREEPFRRERIELSDPLAEVPEVEVGEFDILLPDSTGFFASWYEVAAERASFCSGWLNSEMEQEYVFERKADGLWYLTDYIGPMYSK